MGHNIDDYNKSLTAEERSAAAQRASAASAEKRRRTKLWKESVEHIVSGVLTEEDAGRIREKFNIEKDVDLTHQDKIISAITERAEKGDKEAAQFLRDTVGQNPQLMVKVGNLDDKPFQTIDLGSLSDEELRRLAEQQMPKEEA